MATTTTKATNTTLPKSVFAVEIPNHELLKLAYDAYLANGRVNLAKTLKRGEVRGGGKKPWKQKGTGRARFGSSRNPIWRKGGVVFGPSGNENYSKQINVKAKRVAIRQALTLAAQAKEIAVIDDIKTTGKTAEIVKWLADQKVEGKNIVIVVDTKTPELVRATNNLQNVSLVQATYLNVFTILNADKLMMTKAAVKAVEEWLGA
ncbi:MAG TPA: 50S ribosomal protein L4 [Candidatus Saccharimonadales bacterium]|nr:50S ribosomal protein L4 [Candidatus Saccharimonadales bacterium]